MTQYATSQQMKKIDRLAQERFGIPSLILMENAGRLSAEEILKKFKRGKAAVFCGKGNNGGDGFVCARYLAQNDINTDVYLLDGRRHVKNGDPRTNMMILAKVGVPLTELTSPGDIKKLKRNFRYDIVVDAIFGTGFQGALAGNVADVVNLINQSRAFVYAIDVPSGLDATTGHAQGACVKAGTTITFGLPKTGFRSQAAKRYVGRLVVKNIGFPKQLLK